MAKDDAGSFLTRWEAVIKATPRNGHVMEPTHPWEHEAASIICGHPMVRCLSEGETAEFETFIREVLRTIGPRRISPR